MVVRYSYEEMVLLRIMELNPLLPHWASLAQAGRAHLALLVRTYSARRAIIG
jgi:hypothetical protein